MAVLHTRRYTTVTIDPEYCFDNSTTKIPVYCKTTGEYIYVQPWWVNSYNHSPDYVKEQYIVGGKLSRKQRKLQKLANYKPSDDLLKLIGYSTRGALIEESDRG